MKLTLDNTSCSAIERCPEYFHDRHELGLVPIAIATPLSFGGAYHIGKKVYYDSGRDVVEACAAFSIAWQPYEGLDKKRTEEKGHELLLAYDEQFRDEPWVDKKGEIEFNLPIGAVCLLCGREFDPYSAPETCECGGEVLLINYAGIIDRIGLYHGEWTIHEFKTSSVPRDFVVRPNNQVTGYVWGAMTLLGQPFKNSLVTISGIFKSSVKGFYYPTVEGKKSTTPVSVISRHFTPRTTEELADFRMRVVDDALRIVQFRESGNWTKWTDNCGYKYGLCPYQPLCQAPMSQHKFLMETAYRVEEWTPGKRPANE